MTIEEFFEDFLTKNVNLRKTCEEECDGSNSDCDICMVTSRHKELAEDLKKELKILSTEDEESKPSTFLTGSYRRHTMIRPPKDVDFFVVLDSGEYQDDELNDLITPKKLLNKLYGALENILKNEDVKIKKQRHSVTVIYDETFSIDVIPAFETDDKKSYMIADVEKNQGSGRYIISNPKVHYKYINDINESTAINEKKRFKKIVRLLKYVKRERFNVGRGKIRSFHFELLAAKILGKEKISSYSEGINNFFSHVHKYFDKSSLVDPANSDNKIDDYIDELSSEIKESIKEELKELSVISQNSLDYEKEGKDSKAIKEWEKFFQESESLKQAHKLAQSISTFGTIQRPSSYDKKTITVHKPWAE